MNVLYTVNAHEHCCVQAEKQTFYHHHEFATLVINVTRANSLAPIITSSLPNGSFDGYIYENSLSETYLLDSLLSTVMYLEVTDPNLVILHSIYCTELCNACMNALVQYAICGRKVQ